MRKKDRAGNDYGHALIADSPSVPTAGAHGMYSHDAATDHKLKNDGYPGTVLSVIVR